MKYLIILLFFLSFKGMAQQIYYDQNSGRCYVIEPNYVRQYFVDQYGRQVYQDVQRGNRMRYVNCNPAPVNTSTVMVNAGVTITPQRPYLHLQVGSLYQPGYTSWVNYYGRYNNLYCRPRFNYINFGNRWNVYSALGNQFSQYLFGN